MLEPNKPKTTWYVAFTGMSKMPVANAGKFESEVHDKEGAKIAFLELLSEKGITEVNFVLFDDKEPSEPINLEDMLEKEVLH